MSAAQLTIILSAALVAMAVIAYGYRRESRYYQAQVAEIKRAKRLPHRDATGCNAILRDAAYLVQRHLDGLPTSRRQSHLPDRSWTRAMSLVRSAGLGRQVGQTWVWEVQDYPSAFESLQGVCRDRAVLQRQGRFVEPW